MISTVGGPPIISFFAVDDFQTSPIVRVVLRSSWTHLGLPFLSMFIIRAKGLSLIPLPGTRIT